MQVTRFLRRRALYVEIWLGLAWARFLTRFVRLGRWKHLLGDMDTHAAEDLPAARIEQAQGVGRIVAHVARGVRMFDAVCLPQAMAARWVLARRGIPSRIVIGSRREDGAGTMHFHAWLLAGGEVVTGAREQAAHQEMVQAGPNDAAI